MTKTVRERERQRDRKENNKKTVKRSTRQTRSGECFLQMRKKITSRMTPAQEDDETGDIELISLTRRHSAQGDTILPESSSMSVHLERYLPPHLHPHSIVFFLIISLHSFNLCNSQVSPSTTNLTSTLSSFQSVIGIEPLYHQNVNGRPIRSYSEEFMTSSEERERNLQFGGGQQASAAATSLAEVTSTSTSGNARHRIVPHFDVESLSTNVTISEGSAFVHLPCRVKQLGERTLSWIRRKDFQILTVGKFTYTSDQRLQVIHLDNSDDWSLQISYPQKKDAGIYECQVATMPKISLFVQLNVVVSRAQILESPTLYLSSGTTLNLTCIVRDTPEPPDYIFWYFNGQVINYGSPRGIKVTVEKGAATVSRLVVERAQPNDSGNYSCTPANAEAAHIAVHVQSNTNPAASLQHGKRSAREFGNEAHLAASIDNRVVLVLTSVVALGVHYLPGLLIQC